MVNYVRRALAMNLLVTQKFCFPVGAKTSVRNPNSRIKWRTESVRQTHGATDLRGAIHTLSGVTVLYPLLELMKSWKMWSEPRSLSLGDSIINAEEYPVASFLQLIRRVLSGPEVALRALSIESNAFAVLGALLQRLPGRNYFTNKSV